MLKNSIRYGFIAITLVMTFVSCNKDKEEPVVQEVINDLTTDKDAVALIIGENAQVQITSGNGDYSIASANETIATASISDKNIKIEAKKEGETTLTLKDKKGKEVRISVKVFKNLSVAQSEVTLKIRSEVKISIAGNGEFEASVDNTNAVAKIENEEVKITANAVGTSVVTIKNKKTNKTTTINVTVEDYPAVVVAQNEVEILLNGTKEIAISGGAEETYNTTTNNDKVSVVVEDKKLKIRAVAVGNSIITIKDEKAQKEVQVRVTVMANDIVLTQNEVEIFIGATTEIGVSGGTGNFAVSVNNAHATAVIENGKVKITGVSAGTSEVKVKDETAGKEKKIKVIVKYNNLTTSTTSLSVYGKLITNTGQTEEGEKKTFTISGGSGNYQVQASSNVILVTKKSNTEWEVQGNTQNNNGSTATITITDLSTNQTATIEVQVMRAFQIYDTSLQINAEETKTISYYGTKPTSIIVQNPDFVEVSISDISDASGKKTISLKGKTAGTTNVTFSDGRKSYTLGVVVKPKLEFSLLNLRNQSLTIASDEDEVELKVKGSGDFSVTLSDSKADYDVSTEKDDSCDCYPIIFTRNENDDTGRVTVTVKDNILNQSKSFTLIIKP